LTAWRTRAGEVMVVDVARVHGLAVVEENTMTADTKKSMTNTSPKTKPATEASEPLKPNTPKVVTVVRRPAMPASAETTLQKPAEAKPKKPTTYEARMRALAPVMRLRKKLTANVTRLSKVAREVQRWANGPAELRDAATTVTTALAAMLTVATGLPDDFMPERERKGSARQLTVGTKVTLREKAIERYADVIAPEDRATLEVASIGRTHVFVKTAAGALVVLPRNQVVKATTT
jgi:hypothetical protein